MMNLWGIELRAVSKTYRWNNSQHALFRHTTLPSVGTNQSDNHHLMARNLRNALMTSKPDVVAVNGWGDAMAPQSIQWCVSNQIPFVLMSESTAIDRPRNPMVEGIKRRIVGLASGALVGGKPHQRYLTALGMSPERIFTGYDAVDNEYYAAMCAQVRAQSQSTESRPFFLASSRFIKRKNLDQLIHAFATSKARLGWDLCILGDGELKMQLIAQGNSLGLRVGMSAPWESDQWLEANHLELATVYFPGFRQIEELPTFYGRAGFFVHPALTEPWGLVVNEAMACSLPVIVSERCGCVEDLVKTGRNGWIFDPRDTDQLVQLLDLMTDTHAATRTEMGKESERIVAKFSPHHFAAGLRAACTLAYDQPARSPRIPDRLLISALSLLR